jgi:hypothetical protein
MSRSNPQENVTNPSTRWFKWNGEKGEIRYYDRDTKQTVDVGQKFTFVLLDELASVRGWHDPSQSGIYSNEVRDTRQDALVVKSFKGGILAEGLYREIKDRVNASGGEFVASCYVGYSNGPDGELAIGNLGFKGAALREWMEFRKANRHSLYTKGVRITGFAEDTKGRIAFRVPVLKLVDLTEQTHKAAVGLDLELQTYLHAYLTKTKQDQVDAVETHLRDEDVTPPPPAPAPATTPSSVFDDDVPF